MYNDFSNLAFRLCPGDLVTIAVSSGKSSAWLRGLQVKEGNESIQPGR